MGAEQLHAEWTRHDSSGDVVVYLFDSPAKSDAVISAAIFLITTKIGETKKACELNARRSSARFNVFRSFNNLEAADRGPHTLRKMNREEHTGWRRVASDGGSMRCVFVPRIHLS